MFLRIYPLCINFSFIFSFSFDCIMYVTLLYLSIIFLVSKDNLFSICFFIFWKEVFIISS